MGFFRGELTFDVVFICTPMVTLEQMYMYNIAIHGEKKEPFSSCIVALLDAAIEVL